MESVKITCIVYLYFIRPLYTCIVREKKVLCLFCKAQKLLASYTCVALLLVVRDRIFVIQVLIVRENACRLLHTCSVRDRMLVMYVLLCILVLKRQNACIEVLLVRVLLCKRQNACIVSNDINLDKGNC